MRLLLSWIDQLRRITAENLASVSSALVSQFEEIVTAANAWAGEDHDPTGVHTVVKFKAQSTTPPALAGHLVTYWDGTNLKYVKPDGSTGNIV